MTGNIIGEPINEVILEQISNRQTINGAGYNDTSISRSPEVLNYLNNRTAWVKMASGISIGDAAVYQLTEISKQEGGYISEVEIQNLKGTSLAKNLVLFNTIQSFDAQGKNEYTARSGVREDNLLQNGLGKMYGGIGGNSQGLQPVGGITGITVENINRGSIAKATVNIKVYNRFQFNLVELVYLKLGYIMMLEWGWDKYIDKIDKENDSVEIKNMPYTIIEKEWFDTNKSFTQRDMLNLIEKYRSLNKGNYDGFFGKVSNFTWTANNDGSYDIVLDLITLGSVIESMKINLTPSKPLDAVVLKNNQEKLAELLDQEATDEGNYDSEIISNMGGDKLSRFLSTAIINFPPGHLDYVYSPALATELIPISYGTIGALNAIPVIGTGVSLGLAFAKYLTSYTGNIPEEDRYYIRLGLFLDQLKGLSIPYVKNGNTKELPSLDIDTSIESNVCNYVTNLIPLDPSICIFSIQLSEEFENMTYLDVNNYNSNMREFAKVKDKVIYGQIMNINMNINFLQKAIVENTDEDGNLTLFNFLEKICQGINECTGGTTALEPAIKEDNIIYLLEQNSIKGFGFEGTGTAPIEIQGYSSDGKSNFVQEFSFNTKITPDMMSMISIGATAEGIDSRQINVSPWKKWYRGIVNRFEESYVVKKEEGETAVLEPGKTDPKIIKERFKSDLIAGNIDYDHVVLPGYDWSWNGHDLADINPPGIHFLGVKSDATNAENEALLEEVVRRVHEVEDEDIAYAKEQANKGNDVTVVGEGEIPPGQEYKQYFIEAFGGSTGLAQKRSFWPGYKQLDIDRDDSLWWYGKDNSDFINRGKSSFNQYMTQLNNKEAQEALAKIEAESTDQEVPATSTNGFIPVELGLTVDGISGIKIYQKLEVTQRFLPVAYSKALRFIIRGVNHTIEGNQWKTELATISTTISNEPPSDQPVNKYKKKSSPAGSPQTPVAVQGPIPPTDPNQKLKIYDKRTVAGIPFDNRTYKTYQSIDWLVQEMNIHTQSTWKGFLEALNQRYPGYTLIINATYRTYQRSIELKRQNPNNASPGYSPHNYAYGMDMNVKDPSGKVYMKKDYASWKASGIPEIAVKEFNMRWGGDFSGYLDCVHFDVTRVTSASRRNAKAENQGLPQEQWVTKDTNYV